MAEGAGADAGVAGGEGESGESQGGIDFSPVFERFEQLVPRLEGLEQTVSRLAEPPAEEGAEEDDPYAIDLDALYGPVDEGEAPQERQLNPEALQSMIDARAQQLLQQHLDPLQQQVQSIQVGLDAEALTARYPDLAKEEVAGPVVERARSLAEAMGNPALAQNTQFVEVVYKAQMADARAAGERPAGAEQGFELERAGGAGPAAGEEPPNIADRLIARHQDGAFWKSL
jgi:hypothetical protein